MRTSLPVKKDNKQEFATFYLVFCERVILEWIVNKTKEITPTSQNKRKN